ncbi:PASTA domain-containing protein [bacterium]|nr:PASTA domain-containing protein [bacterium]
MITFFRKNAPEQGLFIAVVCIASLVAFTTGTIATLLLMQRITIAIVPDLSNKSVESARSVLRVKRLRMDIAEYRFDQRIAGNHILEQEPLSGQTVESGQVVKVVVSRGARTLTIPTLSGLTLSAAEKKLKAEGFHIGRVTRYYTTEAEKEIILDQFPTPGSNAARGTNIYILVSQGPRPFWLLMPSFKDWSVDDAMLVLNTLGMKLKEIKRQVDSMQPNGIVLKQTPLTGTRIKAGDPAGLVVSIQSSSEVSQSTRFVTIDYVVPHLTRSVRVKFMVRDEQGLHEIYNAMEKPNTPLSIQRRINGLDAQLYIYLNGELYEERLI